MNSVLLGKMRWRARRSGVGRVAGVVMVDGMSVGELVQVEEKILGALLEGVKRGTRRGREKFSMDLLVLVIPSTCAWGLGMLVGERGGLVHLVGGSGWDRRRVRVSRMVVIHSLSGSGIDDGKPDMSSSRSDRMRVFGSVSATLVSWDQRDAWCSTFIPTAV